jgi:hypothetical protein
MNVAAIAGLVLLALLVGAALPVLAQARVSLRAWQKTVEEAGEPAVAAALRTMRESRPEQPRKENHHEAA